MKRIIDFDHVEIWGPWFTQIMEEIAPRDLMGQAAGSSFEYTSDAGDFFKRAIGLEVLLTHLISALASYDMRIFHGTRLSELDLQRVEQEGLRPLDLQERRLSIESVFAHHPDWTAKSHLLEDQLFRFGPGWERRGVGKREDGCVHFCISRAGVMRGCNHYLTHGAEVEGHIGRAIFGDQLALDLLAQHRRPRLICVLKPAVSVIAGGNPWGFPSDDLPSILGELVDSWAYRLANPGYRTVAEESCTALRLGGPISRDRIEAIVEIDDADLA